MGVHAMVKGLLARVKTSNTTNPRAVRALSRRANDIAEDLEKSDNVAQMEEFQNIIATVAQQLKDASGNVPDNIANRMAPDIYARRQAIILQADEQLNRIKAPPKGRFELMRKATMEDAKSLGFELSGLTNAREGLLRDISEPVGFGTTGSSAKPPGKSTTAPSAEEEYKPMNRKTPPLYTQTNKSPGTWSVGDVDNPARSPSPEQAYSMLSRRTCDTFQTDDYSYQSGSKLSHHYMQQATREYSPFSEGGLPQAWSIQNEKAHVQLKEKLLAIDNGDRDPSFLLPISDMCAEDGAATSQVIPLDHTFGELADTVLARDNDAPLPDFWSKKMDPSRNSVTTSGVWWEWQDPSTRVADVIMKKKKDGSKESMGIESVSKESEYVVALVEKDEKEGGMPIELPRRHRQPASQHLQNVVFPHFTVSEVLELQSGQDASEKLFDKRCFTPMTNPVFIKVHARSGNDVSLESEPVKSVLGMNMEGVTFNPVTLVCDTGVTKGKGKEKTGSTSAKTTQEIIQRVAAERK